jgi:hypothetical protein
MLIKLLDGLVIAALLAFGAWDLASRRRRARRGEPQPADPMEGMIQPVPGPNEIPPDVP